MTASATHRRCCHADAERAPSLCVAGNGFWYGYFMTGVPAAMS
nr:hypothetical protein [uncultured Halomonas sp.]